jgi:hypothetical protein
LSGDLAGSWAAYQQLVAAGVGAGGGTTSLDELLGSQVAAPRGNGADPVDIRTLLYKGDRARQRAQELREAAKRASGDDLRGIIDEVCDLVVLALQSD